MAHGSMCHWGGVMASTRLLGATLLAALLVACEAVTPPPAPVAEPTGTLRAASTVVTLDLTGYTWARCPGDPRPHYCPEGFTNPPGVTEFNIWKRPSNGSGKVRLFSTADDYGGMGLRFNDSTSVTLGARGQSGGKYFYVAGLTAAEVKSILEPPEPQVAEQSSGTITLVPHDPGDGLTGGTGNTHDPGVVYPITPDPGNSSPVTLQYSEARLIVRVGSSSHVPADGATHRVTLSGNIGNARWSIGMFTPKLNRHTHCDVTIDPSPNTGGTVVVDWSYGLNHSHRNHTLSAATTYRFDRAGHNSTPYWENVDLRGTELTLDITTSCEGSWSGRPEPDIEIRERQARTIYWGTEPGTTVDGTTKHVRLRSTAGAYPFFEWRFEVPVPAGQACDMTIDPAKNRRGELDADLGFSSLSPAEQAAIQFVERGQVRLHANDTTPAFSMTTYSAPVTLSFDGPTPGHLEYIDFAPENGRQIDMDVTVTCARPPDPTITIRATNAAIDEGGSVSVKLSAWPNPMAPLTVNVRVTETGAMVTGSGASTVTIPTSGSVTLSAASTHDDSVLEDDSTVTVTVQPGAGYDVGTPSAAEVLVWDDENDYTGTYLITDIGRKTLNWTAGTEPKVNDGWKKIRLRYVTSSYRPAGTWVFRVAVPSGQSCVMEIDPARNLGWNIPDTHADNSFEVAAGHLRFSTAHTTPGLGWANRGAITSTTFDGTPASGELLEFGYENGLDFRMRARVTCS